MSIAAPIPRPPPITVSQLREASNVSERSPVAAIGTISVKAYRDQAANTSREVERPFLVGSGQRRPRTSNAYAVPTLLPLQAQPILPTVVDRGRVLAESYGVSAAYTIKGDESYVRAKITDSDGKQAWTQPVFVTGGARQ
jgi:hypothetical protein